MEPTSGLIRFGLSCAKAILNLVTPLPSQRNSSCGRGSPTSPSRISAGCTSSCLAFLLLHARTGNSTSASEDLKPELEAGWPGRQRRPLSEELQFGGHDGFCG